jgi:ribosomal-protein-alanine N-acetyltransferase
MQPTLETDRLVLRPFTASDAERVQVLAGEYAIADTTLNIPHPYEEGMAEAWISTHAAKYAAEELAAFAVTLKDGGTLIGAVGLEIDRRFQRGELGYWIGVPYWNQGFCTEASKAVVDFGFFALGLHKICAHHLTRNPASGRVMQKVGMTREGTLREHVIKWGRHEDVDLHGMISTVEKTSRP